MTRANVSISGATHERLAQYAQDHGVTIASVVEQACAETPNPYAIGVSLPLYERICAHAKKQGITPELVIELAMQRLTRREP